MKQEVGTGKKSLHPLVFFLSRLLALAGHDLIVGRVIRVGAKEILKGFGIIGGAEDLPGIFKAIAKAKEWMIEILGHEHNPIAKIKAAFLEIDICYFGGQFGMAYWEVAIGQLTAHNIFQGFIFIVNGCINFNLCPGNINWGKKEKPHNVVPMGVGQVNLSSDRAFWEITGHHVVAEFSNAGTGINNNEPVRGLKTQTKANSISAVFYCLRARAGDRPSCPHNFSFIGLPFLAYLDKNLGPFYLVHYLFIET